MGKSEVRLRQVVIAARNLGVAGELRARIGLGPPFHDPAVAYFGLRNAVMALGDTFAEGARIPLLRARSRSWRPAKRPSGSWP